MRSFLVSTVAAAAVMTMATSGSAGEPTTSGSSPTGRPRIVVAPQVRVAGFHRATGQAGAYAGGALGITVDVENTGSTAVQGVVVKLDIGEKVLETTLSIPARATRAATFTDDEGLASSCKPKPYAITLAGSGTSGGARAAHVTPACTFASSLEQTWNMMSPDRVEAQKSGNVYLSSPSIMTAPACGKGPTMKVRIVSKASSSSPSIIVQAKDWSANGQIKAQSAAAFPIAPNEQKEIVLSPVTGGDGDVPAKMKLGIVDWTKSLGGHTSDGGIFVNTTRSCSLDFALD